MEISSFIAFGRLIKGKKWDRVKIHREFKNRVDKDDYSRKDVEDIVEHFFRLSWSCGMA